LLTTEIKKGLQSLETLY